MKRVLVWWILSPFLLGACGSSSNKLFGTGPASCQPDQLACGAACVDPQTDQVNCGTCGTACAKSETCVSGTCSPSCTIDEKLCAGTCVDPQTNAAHCGECGHACTPAQACVAGACKGGLSCADGRTLCGSKCADTSNDPLHCGGCDHTCGAGQVCNGGVCKDGGDCNKNPCTGLTYCDLATGQCKPGCLEQSQCGSHETCDPASHACVCEAGFHTCGSCVSNAAVESCGSSSCTPCAAPAHATASCTNGSCAFACNSGYHTCGNVCASDASPDSCGASCNPCPTVSHGSATCVAGVCGIACDSGFHLCNGQCVPSDSVQTCGNSCVPCTAPANASPTCVNGACAFACQSGFHACSGACVSNGSVSSCGSSCSPCAPPAHATPTCQNGACDFVCSAGYHRCGSQCLSDASPDSCGTACSPCTAPANASATCVSGQCGFACVSGYHACAAACFSDADPAHCGSACTQCPAPTGSTAVCQNNACSFTCTMGTIPCNGTCIACADAHGTAACVGNACSITCNAGWHTCGGVCVDSTDPAHCGASCNSCPSVPNGTSTCTQGQCGITCQGGYQMCSNACAACPDPKGVESFTCSGASCVVAACKTGYYACGGACCQLTTEVIETGNISGEPSSALDSLGRVHVAYYVSGSPSALKYAVRTAPGTWQIQTVPNASSSGSLALDSSDRPRIAFRTSYAVNLASWTGTGWSNETVYSSSWGYGPEVGTQGLVVDAAGGAHVAIGQTQGGPYSSNIMHHYKASGSWTYQTLGSESSAISAPTIARAGNLMHVTWIGYTPKALRYRYYDGNAWQSETPSSQAYCCADSYVTLGPAGAPFIGFELTSGGYGVVQKSGTTWQPQTLLAQISTPYNLAVGSSSEIHFLYANWVNSTQILYYAKPGSGSWTQYSLAKDGAGRILLDTGNQAHIVYADGTGIYYVRP